MLGTIIRVMIAASLGAAAVTFTLITGHLHRLETGLAQNVRAARAPVEVQKAIRDRNAIIQEMTAITTRISGGLDSVLLRSQAIADQVAIVGEANKATVAINRQMVEQNDLAAADLAKVAVALEGMNRSVTTIRQYLNDLAAIARADIADLDAVASSTARMAVKTPTLGR